MLVQACLNAGLNITVATARVASAAIGHELGQYLNLAPLNVLISDVGYDGVFNINVALTGVDAIGLNGNVIVTVAGKEYTVKVTDGKGIATGDKLAAGTYGFAAVWAGDDNYNIVTENGDFKVNKVDSAIDVAVSDIKVGEDAVISIAVPEITSGVVSVTVGDAIYNVAVVDGKGSLTLSGLASGSYDVVAKFNGDDKYLASEDSAKFNVTKLASTIDIAVDNIKVGENAVIGVALPEDATGVVNVTVGKDSYK
mgnify:CR=1 FL=1